MIVIKALAVALNFNHNFQTINFKYQNTYMVLDSFTLDKERICTKP